LTVDGANRCLQLYFDTLGGAVEFRILINMKMLHTSGLSQHDVFTIMNAILLVLSVASGALSIRSLLRNLQVLLVCC
jgi:hypothetical protein